MKFNFSIFTVVALAIGLLARPCSAQQTMHMPWHDPFVATSASLGPASFSGFLDDSDSNFDSNFIDTAYDDSMEMAAFGQSATGGYGGKCIDGLCGSGGMLWNSWLSLEYMNAWTDGRRLPPLVTTSPPGTNGVLPNATVLFGGEDVGEDVRSGIRISFGSWLSPDLRVGFGGKFFGVENDSTTFATTSNETPLIARPFFNSRVVINAQDALIVTSPGIRTGNIAVDADTNVLGAEAYGRLLLACGDGYRVDLIGGYQFSRIDDSLTINHRMQQIGGGGGGIGSFPIGSTFFFEDVFDARNEYHGGQVGLWGHYDYGRVTLSLLAKLGLGNMHQNVKIRGRSTVNDTFSTGNFNSGLLAVNSTNAGEYVNDTFVIVPEAEVKLSYCLSEHVDLSIGYSFLFWSDVALAADQIDTSRQNTPTVNSTGLLDGNVVGPRNPAFTGIQDTGFWLQGINLGVTLRH